MTTEAGPALATDQVAEYVAGARYEHLPQPVSDYTKLCILDSLGCAIGGSRLPAGQVVLDVMGQPGGAAEAMLLPTGQRLPVQNAAYVNGYLASVMDFDDFFIVHPGVCAVPPAIAVADYVGASGRELLNAVVLAYEIQLRVARAIQPSPERWRLVGGCSTPQVFGAMAAAASLLRLTAEQVISALGLAAANAPVPHKTNRSIGGNPRPLSWVQGNPGWIDMGGVLAARMAQRGFQGRLEILDGAMGFWMMAGSDRCDFTALGAELGQRFDVMNVAFKPYSGCRYIHSSIDALRAVLARHPVRAEDVQRLVVRSYPTLGSFMDYQP